MHFCHQCNYNTTIKSNYNKHLETKKHIRNTNKERIKKSTLKCPYCDKTFTRKDSLIRHIKKYCRKTNNVASNSQKLDKWTCPKCFYTFKHHSSYYRHKKKDTCSHLNTQDIQPNYENDLRNILIKLKDNTKLEKIIYIVFDVYNK